MISNQENLQQQLELLENFPDLKSFDLYQHMKINVKEFERNCKDFTDSHDNIGYYCIPCKVSICNTCNFNTHKNHFLIKKLNFELDKDTVEKMFKQLEVEMTSHDVFVNSSVIKQELKEIVNAHIEQLHSKLEDIKDAKFEEINSLFKNEGTINVLKKNIDDIKHNITNFFEKNKKFLNYDKFNNDQENTIFLIVFEMLNMCLQKNKEIKGFLHKIIEDYENYKEVLKKKTNHMMKILEEFIVEESKEEEMNKPATSIHTNFEKLTADFYKDIKLRTQKYNEHIENFKTLTFDTINKTGSFKEIEKIINLFDKKNEKGIAFIFNHELPEDQRSVSKSPSNKFKTKQMSKSGKKPLTKSIDLNGTNGNNNGLFKEYMSHQTGKNVLNTEEDFKSRDESQIQQENNVNLYKLAANIKNRNDVRLDNRIIQRYFSYATLDTVNKNFRIKTNAGGTSSAYLLIKPEFDLTEEADVCKPIIGTNEIQIYDRKKRTLIKKKVNLDKQLHGYSNFLDGTRHLLVGDKLFIIGGRDENQEYSTVLTYDIKESHLKRVPDMKVPHSYHSLDYNEIFKSILVIGGQNNKSCELFDLFTNRWRLLPELSFPRANVAIYFDKSENHIYAMFGMKGEITQNDNNSDVIEVLELQDMGKGWVTIDYNNKSDLDFKLNYCRIYPLTRDKLLIYGANNKYVIKSFAVYHMTKCEIIKVDKKLLEDLRLQARKSTKLSKILSTMSK